jgi:hypothetical protein
MSSSTLSSFRSKGKAFLDKQKITLSPKVYFVDAMGAMALGLFATLLIGTIFKALGNAVFPDQTSDFFHVIASYAGNAYVYGAAIGVAVAYKLQAPPLVVYSCSAVGAMGGMFTCLIGDISYTAGPAGSFLAVLFACEIGKLAAGRTKIDILVTPALTLSAGFLATWLFCPLIARLIYGIRWVIESATDRVPLIMGILLAVIMGMVLTLPISSAALCAMIFSTAGGELSETLMLAAGAAAVGCCCQMVGFAVTSFRENKWGGLVAQGLGTSMLQMGNICKRPAIWIAPTLAAAICGPLSTVVFELKCSGVNAGMGTCGLLSPWQILMDMQGSGKAWIGVLLCCFLLPAFLSLLFDWLLRKIGWVKAGDMKLDL